MLYIVGTTGGVFDFCKNSRLLRSPVASIIGLIDLVEERGIASEHNKRLFEFLKKAIMKLDSVIYEINDDTRVE